MEPSPWLIARVVPRDVVDEPSIALVARSTNGNAKAESHGLARSDVRQLVQFKARCGPLFIVTGPY